MNKTKRNTTRLHSQERKSQVITTETLAAQRCSNVRPLAPSNQSSSSVAVIAINVSLNISHAIRSGKKMEQQRDAQSLTTNVEIRVNEKFNERCQSTGNDKFSDQTPVFWVMEIEHWHECLLHLRDHSVNPEQPLHPTCLLLRMLNGSRRGRRNEERVLNYSVNFGEEKELSRLTT